MPDGPPLAKLAAVVNAFLSSPSVGYFVNWCARPSLSRWILRFRVIPERYAIAFACMPDGPSLACWTARFLIDASSASKASALVRRSLAVVKHIPPPIVFSIVYTFRTPSVKHDAVVVSACRTARFLHAGRPVTRSASFHDIRRREIAPADYPRSVSFLPVLHARPRSAVMLRLPLAGCACLACRTARLACRTARLPLGRRCAAGCWAQQQVVFLR